MPTNVADKAWYIVTTYSMRESKTAANLRTRISTMGMENLIKRVLVAEQMEPLFDKETGLPNGKTKMKNLFPGYIFVEMVMTDESWYIVRNTPGVTGIAGSSGGGQKPMPVPNEQMETILKRMNQVDESMKSRYHTGDKVKIIGGPFEGNEGVIEAINGDIYTVKMSLFGNESRFELEFADIQII